MHNINSIIENMEMVFCGNPWYGKSVVDVLNMVDPSKVYIKPSETSHSMIELLYHMLTWEEFTLDNLEGRNTEPETFQSLDWRETNPSVHTWNNGVAQLKATHNKIIISLKDSDESILESPVPYKDYNIETLLKGLVEHNIYHTGQIAFLNKLLS